MSGKMITTDIDLDAMMDVVAMYKCKFCAHTSETQVAMKEHLAEHVMASGTPASVKGDCDQHIAADGGVIPGASQVITEIDQVLLDSAVTTEPNLTEELLATNSQTLLLEDLSQPDGVMLAPLNSQSEACPGGMDSLSGTVNAVMATKEFFLCGQCNSGFDSMEDCKTHIEQDHQLVVCVDDGEDAAFIKYDAKPSIGTQADGDAMMLWKKGKKRGRKRKGEKAAEEDAGSFDEELAKQLFDDDEYRVSLASTRGAGKRRIKPPKSLLNEYFVGVKDDEQEGAEVRDSNLCPTSDPEAISQQNAARETEPMGGDHVLVTAGGDDTAHGKNMQHSDSNLCADDDPGDSYLPSETEEKEAEEEENDVVLNEATDVNEGSDLNEDHDENTGGHVNTGRDESTKTVESVESTHKSSVGDGPRKKRRKLEKSVLIEKVPRMKIKYKCPKKFCKGKFARKGSYEAHQACHNKRGGLVCFKCGEKFKFWLPCLLHLWKNHQIDLDLYRCEHCDFRTNMACKLNVHKAIHSEIRPYVCKVCGRGFKQASQLINHETLHGNFSADVADWLTQKRCRLCDQSFTTEKSLRIHVNAVHGRGKFSCPSCDHATTSKAALLTHIRTHTGEKPFKCDYCGFACADYNTLRRHRMRHTGDRPYVCHLCSYSCIQSVSLKSHLKTKHGGAEGLWCCELCGFGTVSEKRWVSHCADHHNGVMRCRPQQEGMNQKFGQVVCSDGQSANDVIIPTTDVLPPSVQKAAIMCSQCGFVSSDMNSMLAHMATSNHQVPSGSANQDLQGISANHSAVDANGQTKSVTSEPSVLSQAVNQIFGEKGLVAADIDLSKTQEQLIDSNKDTVASQTLFVKKLPNGDFVYETNTNSAKCIDLSLLQNSQVIRINSIPHAPIQQKQTNSEIKPVNSTAISPQNVINITPVSGVSPHPSLKAVFDGNTLTKSESYVIPVPSQSDGDCSDSINISLDNAQNSNSLSTPSVVSTLSTTGWESKYIDQQTFATGNLDSNDVIDSCQSVASGGDMQASEQASNEYVYSVNEEGNIMITVLPSDARTLFLTEEGVTDESQSFVVAGGGDLSGDTQPFVLSDEGQLPTESHTVVFTEADKLCNESQAFAFAANNKISTEAESSKVLISNDPQSLTFIEENKLPRGPQSFIFTESGKLSSAPQSFIHTEGGTLRPVNDTSLTGGHLVVTGVDGMSISAENM